MHQSTPLAALFLLIAVAGMFAAQAVHTGGFLAEHRRALAARQSQPWIFSPAPPSADRVEKWLYANTSVGLLIGLVTGIVIGTGGKRRVRSVVSGGLLGMIIGALAGAQLSCPSHFALWIGSPLLIVYGLIVRRFSAGPSHADV